MLADLKVVETSNKDDGRTVEKIKGVNLIGKEAGCHCRPHVSEERSPISSAWNTPFLSSAPAFLWVPWHTEKSVLGHGDEPMKTPCLMRREHHASKRGFEMNHLKLSVQLQEGLQAERQLKDQRGISLVVQCLGLHLSMQGVGV